MRLIIIAILVILWLLFGIFTMQDCFKDVLGCGNGENVEEVSESAETPAAEISPPTTTPKATGPLLFNWDKEGAITGDGWDAKRKAILDGLKDDEILQIMGEYRADEVNNTTFKNLGLARANEVAKLFIPPLSSDRIKEESTLVKDDVSDKASPFKSVIFENIKMAKGVVETDDKALIYFPFNSTNKLKDAEVEAYLNDVAKRVKASGERVRLTGHTDNVGSDMSNQTLGQRRANIVKQYLIARGVSASKINASSRGETKPVATNETSAGRAQNRRTELEIIK